jgi:membrane protein implicated in regulation of membrane protease activity
MKPDSNVHLSGQSGKQRSTPLWETFVIGGSFVLLWVWWLARQAALRAGETQPWWWQGVLLLALLALLFVLARRGRRVVRALRGEGTNDMPSTLNGHGGPPVEAKSKSKKNNT